METNPALEAAIAAILPLEREAMRIDRRHAAWAGFGPEPTRPDAAHDAVVQRAEELAIEHDLDRNQILFGAYRVVAAEFRQAEQAARKRARQRARNDWRR